MYTFMFCNEGSDQFRDQGDAQSGCCGKPDFPFSHIAQVVCHPLDHANLIEQARYVGEQMFGFPGGNEASTAAIKQFEAKLHLGV